MTILCKILNGTLNVIIPSLCPICKEKIIFSDSGVCVDCGVNVSKIDVSCDICSVSLGYEFKKSATYNKGSNSHICGDCLINKKYFKLSRSAVEYDGKIKDAIIDFKYNRGFHMERLLSDIISKKALNFVDEVDEKFDIIMPVPLHRMRLKDRGYNQSLLLANAVSEKIKVPVDYLRLVRVKDTTPQVKLKQKARAENVKGAFSLEEGDLLKGKKVLLIDDVYTTGATINECSKVLSKVGAEVYGLTVARAVA